jgi:CDP-paratose 2-epimerase
MIHKSGEIDMKVLVIGGAGFIGCQVAAHYLQKGNCVIVLDNFSRAGTLANVRWLEDKNRKGLHIIPADIRLENQLLQETIDQADIIFHMAAQVAVTTSITNPREDFEINVLGTINILEAIRKSSNNPILIFGSTNKVYGGLEDVGLREKEKRYELTELKNGINEEYPLDFHSPYGCSKGAADQYVRDYSRIYGLQTIVFRQSCIYGPRQFGIEDQGWVAHFAISALFDRPLTIYGNGKQLRDILEIKDLICAYEKAIEQIDITKGQIYNIGGGPNNQISLLELIDLLEGFLGKRPLYQFADWRPGDQKIFVSDISKARKDFSWEPKIDFSEGIKGLIEWIKGNRESIASFLSLQ